jgi:hypothetical protein
VRGRAGGQHALRLGNAIIRTSAAAPQVVRRLVLTAFVIGVVQKIYGDYQAFFLKAAENTFLYLFSTFDCCLSRMNVAMCPVSDASPWACRRTMTEKRSALCRQLSKTYFLPYRLHLSIGTLLRALLCSA